MTRILYSFLFLTSFNINAQEAKIIDSTSLAFKAKLFTISQHKYESKKELVDFIDNLSYEIYGVNEFIFFKIKSRYYCQNENDLFTANWCECDYYVCYSIEKDFFYLLGGFKTDNIEDFAKEYQSSTFMTNWKYKITDERLNKFINYISLNKIKKAINSFKKCS